MYARVLFLHLIEAGHVEEIVALLDVAFDEAQRIALFVILQE